MKKSSKTPAAAEEIKPDELYSMAHVAKLAGKAGTREVNSAAMLIARHKLCELMAGRRLIRGRNIAECIRVIQGAKVGRPVTLPAPTPEPEAKPVARKRKTKA
jgi:hypothetical protein